MHRQGKKPMQCWVKNFVIKVTKKTYRWPTDTWKDDQHLLDVREMKLIRETRIKTTVWGITSHQTEWPSKSLQITNVRECVGKRKSSYSVDKKVNWYSHYEKQYGGFLKS